MKKTFMQTESNLLYMIICAVSRENKQIVSGKRKKKTFYANI